MTEKEATFCRFYASNGGNGADAARKAGYSERSARGQASRLLNRDDILQRLKILQQEAEKAQVAGIDEVKQFLTKTMRSAGEKTRDRIRSGEILLKSTGEFAKARDDRQDNDADDDMQRQPEKAVIMLPANGRDPGGENAYRLPDGRIIPMVGHEDEDFYIYIPLEAVKNGQWDGIEIQGGKDEE